MKKSTAPVLEKKTSLKTYYYLLGILVFFIFANTISNNYNLDDDLVTRQHKYTSQGFAGIDEIFTQPYYSDEMGYAYGYRPVAHLSFALEHQFFGEQPGISHFFNVILFALSVVLFFKLLLRWQGEKGLMLAGLATLLFALHPVHTEAIASIKNRDEILAFLFAVLAGLALEKAVSRNKLWSLLWTAFFFALAMLSKKSVYPLAIVFPLAMVLLKDISLKKSLLFSSVLIIPSALIGSELVPWRMLWMFILPYAGICLAFWLRILAARENNMQAFKKVLLDFRLISFVGWILAALAYWKVNYVFFLLALPFFLLVLRMSFRWGIAQLALLGLIMDHVFIVSPLAIFSVVLIFGDAFYLFLEGKNDYRMWIAAVLSMGAFLVHHAYFGDLFPVFSAFAFYFLLFRKPWWGLGYACVVLLVGIFFAESLDFFPIVVAFAAVFSLLEYKKGIRLMQYLPVMGLIVCLLFSGWRGRTVLGNVNNQVSVVVAKRAAPVKGERALQEGRKLEYVENTLVVPHTTSEQIGTGAETLGEYMRLMVFPYELSFYYGFAKLKTVSLENPWTWISLAVHLFLVVLAFWQMKKRPLMSIGVAWYLLSILLFSNWAELVAGMVGERLAFTASAGFCIFIASVILWIKPAFSPKAPRLVELFTALVLVGFLVKTISRNTDWKNAVTLMGTDISHLRNSAQANNLYALNLMQASLEDNSLTKEEQARMQQLALTHFDRALQIWPDFYNAAYDKGRAGIVANDLPQAIEGFEHAITLENEGFLEPHYQLCDLYMKTGRKKDFLGITKKIFALSNDKAEAYSALARGYFVNDYIDSAKIIIKQGLSKFPGDKNLEMNMSVVNGTRQ